MLKFLSVSIVILMLFSFAGEPGTMFPEAGDCAVFIAKDCLTENEKPVSFAAGTFNNCVILRPSERLAGEKDASELTLTITQELLDTLPAETKYVAVCGYEGALAIAVAVMNAEQILYEDGTECISIALRENDEKMLTDKRLVPMSRVSVTVKKDGKFAAADKVEGNTFYTAMLYIPSERPYNYFTTDYKLGLKLYSRGVFIKD